MKKYDDWIAFHEPKINMMQRDIQELKGVMAVGATGVVAAGVAGNLRSPSQGHSQHRSYGGAGGGMN